MARRWVMLAVLAMGCGSTQPGGDKNAPITDVTDATDLTDEELTDPGPSDAPSDEGETDTGSTDIDLHVTLNPALEGVNVLANPGNESGDMTGWTVTSSGGDGWAILGSVPHGGSWEAATSWSLDSRRQAVPLLPLGFTAAELDAEPDIRVEEWVREVCKPGDYYEIGVDLVDGQGNVLDSWGESGTTVNADLDCNYADDAWFLVGATLSGYGPGVRGIVFHDGGHDSEFWAGHYGVRFDDAYVAFFDAP